MSWRFFIPFTELPLVQRVVYTSTLLILGLGYAFASLYVFESHAGRDGDPMLTVEDLIIAYSGSKTSTRPGVLSDGPHVEHAAAGRKPTNHRLGTPRCE